MRLACESSPENFQLDMNEFYTDKYMSEVTKRPSRVGPPVEEEEEDEEEEENTGVISSV